jgi:hypothetical protein
MTFEIILGCLASLAFVTGIVALMTTQKGQDTPRNRHASGGGKNKVQD